MQRQFTFQPSIYLVLTLIAMHGAAMVSLWLLTLQLWAQVTLFFLLLASLLHNLWRYAWLSAPSSEVILMLDGDQCSLVARDGRKKVGKVMGNSLITPLLIVLNVLPQGTSLMRSVIIFPDSLDADSFRQLRVCLKWGC